MTTFDTSWPMAALPPDLAEYLARITPPEHPELAALRARTKALPIVGVMQGSPVIADLLRLLIGITRARQVIEVGVFTGCSTLAMALALPADGRIVAVDVTDKWAAIGQEYWTRSGMADRIDLRIGTGVDVLDVLVAQGQAGTFDLAFIDANKDEYDTYFERALVLLRVDGLMVFDNVLFGGRVPLSPEEHRAREPQDQPKVLREVHLRFADSLRRFNARIAQDPRVDVVVLPVGDGVSLVRKVRADA